MRKSLVILLLQSLCMITQVVHAQNNLWYFGNRCGLDFTSGNPVPVLNSQMYADEGCATVCDQNGNLLFYTNGDSVWDASHALMPNGTGLSGQVSCSQSSLAVRKPGSTTTYYLFTIDAQGNADGLCWSEIDMTLNSGMGDVTANKNVLLMTPSCEKLAAVRHSNGIDVWVVAHGLNSNAFSAYLVSGSGVGAAVVSNAGSTIPASSSNIETIGCMRISCGGTKMAVANYGNYEVQLFDFNNSSGVISNAQTLNSTYRPYGVEFSPNGNYLYISEWNWSGSSIYQYNLSAPNIALSQTVVGAVPSTAGTAASLQLGPDHKIYIAVLYSDSLSEIQNPDQPGMACNFLANALYLGGRTSLAGLPNSVTGGYCIPSNPDAIEEERTDDLISLYPNPAHRTFTIDVKQSDADVEINIFDALGEVVHSAHYGKSSLIEIDASTFSAGIYFITIESEWNYSRKKIIIQ